MSLPDPPPQHPNSVHRPSIGSLQGGERRPSSSQEVPRDVASPRQQPYTSSTSASSSSAASYYVNGNGSTSASSQAISSHRPPTERTYDHQESLSSPPTTHQPRSAPSRQHSIDALSEHSASHANGSSGAPLYLPKVPSSSSLSAHSPYGYDSSPATGGPASSHLAASPNLSITSSSGGPLDELNHQDQRGPIPSGAVGDRTTAATASGGNSGAGSSGEGLGLGSIPETGSGAPTRRGSVAVGTGYDEQDDLIPGGFDEAVLRALCDMDCGMPLLLDRMKQSMASSAEAANFFKKRALIEEEYARSMIKLARSSTQSYSMSEGKAGSYVTSWQSLLRTHELLGENRLKFSAQLGEMSDELVQLGKEVEKNRKSSKDLGTRLERGLAEQEALVDKARNRFDSAAEELERLLIIKQGESFKDNMVPHSSSGPSTANKRSFGKAMSKLKGPKNPAQVAKQEEEVRSRMGQSSDAYRSQVIGAQAVRQEYFNLQLPRILRTLKESADEVDLGTQYHLSRYAYIFESTLVTDGLTISPVTPEDGAGLKAVVDAIDVRDDFKNYMQQYGINWQMSGQRGPRREGPPEDGFLPSARPSLSPRASAMNMSNAAATFTGPTSQPTFGVDLGDQMLRDGVDVPRVLEKCCEAIELHGLDSMGIYRLSGTTSRVQRLKASLDRDIEGTDLLSEENLSDINDIAAVMKLWFRELPEPLLTWELYQGFIDAAKIENDRLRHIRLHERVNDLPDPNYATLKYLMGHLDKVQQREHINQMSSSNLAIVFGPNLLGAPPSPSGQSTALADMQWQSKCIETILHHFAAIFVDEGGE